MSNGGGVWITPDKMYDEIQDVKKGLSDVNSKLDLLILGQTETKAESGDHEKRIRSLEKRQWPLSTLSVLAAIVATVWAIITGNH